MGFNSAFKGLNMKTVTDRSVLTVAMHNTVARAGKRHVVFPGRIIIWRPLKAIFFNIFQSRTGLAKVLKTVGQIADNFRGNSFFFLAC